MADQEHDDDIIIEHPNRDKAGSKLTKLIVFVLLVATTALLVIISIGGWEKTAGAKPLQLVYILLFAFFAFLVLRWSRGILPVVAALSIILLIFAAVSVPGWNDRSKDGFASTTLDPSLLALLCLILIPVQILLIAFSMRGFQQAWNVEVERRRDDDGHRGDGHDDRGDGGRPGAVAAPA